MKNLTNKTKFKVIDNIIYSEQYKNQVSNNTPKKEMIKNVYIF